MSEQEVTVPWIDEPLSLPEAVEAVAQTVEANAEQRTELHERIEALERRVAALEDGSGIDCPSCGENDDVLKSGVAAGKLASEGRLSETNATALNQESHVCLSCQEAFTPGE